MEVQQFRLKQITELKKEIESDLYKYGVTRMKYAKALNTLSYVITGSSAVAGVSAGSSVAVLATGVEAPASSALGGLGLGLGAVSMIVSAVLKKLTPKLQKRTAIVALASAKLCSLRLRISKSLQDENITDEEFQKLMADGEDYRRQKIELQKEWRKTFTSRQVDTDANKQNIEKQTNDQLKPK